MYFVVISLVSLVSGNPVDCNICTVLREGQETSLHVVVSVRGILEVLEDEHCVPLLAASAIFSLNNWIWT